MNALGYITFSILLINSSSILASNATAINGESQFDSLVLKSNKPVIIKVGTTWCPACTRSAAPFDKLAGEFSGVTFATMDADKNDALSNKYGVQSLPTILYFSNGKLATKQVGFNEKDVRNTLNQLQSSSAASPEKKSLNENNLAQIAPAAAIPAATVQAEAQPESQKVEAEQPSCLLQTQNFFERAYNAARDFFVNLGNTVSGWFK